MAVLLIPATTNQVNASSATEFQVLSVSDAVTLSASDLSGGETVSLEYQGPDGSWNTAQNNSGTIQLTADLKQVLVVGPGRYRVSKSSTVAACAVGTT